MEPSSKEVLEAIRRCAHRLGRLPSRSEFKTDSGITPYQLFRHFPSWREAVHAAGLELHPSNEPLSHTALLEDWANLVRRLGRIPTRAQYKLEGKYSPTSYEKHFGPWSGIPARFREFARDNSEWVDVLALMPNMTSTESRQTLARAAAATTNGSGSEHPRSPAYSKIHGRPVYGNPIDFRGLRHEPVNEDGVVFLFGMLARELGYLVEAVQAGFPDCEAKRQIGPDKWQRVRIEFEFESKNFRDHGHPQEGCDVIVCWAHNWADCPSSLEIVELKRIIASLPKSDE